MWWVQPFQADRRHFFLSLVHGVALLGRGANQEKGQWFSANDPLELGDKVKCKGEQAMSL